VLKLGSMEVISLSKEGSVGRSSRSPDYRAVQGSADLVVTRWTPKLRWAELQRGPIPEDELDRFFPPARDGLCVFELWVDPGRCLARQIGSDELNRVLALGRLRDWAGLRGLELEVGPNLPDVVSPRLVELERRRTTEPPTFRFLYPGRHGNRLEVFEWGWGGESVVSDLREPWSGGIGDIFALDRDHAEALFARCPAELRSAAEAALRQWSGADDWQLEIKPGLTPLAEPERQPRIYPRANAVCRGCGSTVGGGFGTAMSFQARGYLRTRCDVCGGRRFRFEALEEKGNLA
jgi:hypothetical protein